MKNFTPFEKQILKKISVFHNDGILPIKKFLEETFFDTKSKRALILQLKEQYAIYFLPTEEFENTNSKKEAIVEFSQFFSLLEYLNSQGVISIFRTNHYFKENLYYIGHQFSNPIVEKNKLLLNPNGLYSIKPEEIRDANNEIVFRGIEYNDSFFIIKNAMGNIIVNDKIQHFFPENEEPEQKKKINKLKIGGYILLFLLLLLPSCLFIIHHHSIQQLITKNNKQLQHKIDNQIITTTQPAIEKKYGIDISRWNGEILKHSLPDSLGFVICKATEGITMTDPLFRYNWERIKEMKLKRGAYHFYVSSDSPKKQANFFWNKIQNRTANDFPPIVDIESGSTTIDSRKLQKNLYIFLNHLEKLSNTTPILYSSYYFANTNIREQKFSKYPLWVADYDSKIKPKVPDVWKEKGWLIWQKTSTHRVNSILSDLNVYNTTQLEAVLPNSKEPNFN